MYDPIKRLTDLAETARVVLPAGKVRDLRINGRWISGCRVLPTDFYPCIVIEEGKETYYYDVTFMGRSWTHINSGSIRMRTEGEVVCTGPGYQDRVYDPPISLGYDQ